MVQTRGQQTSLPTGGRILPHYQREHSYGCERAHNGRRFRSWRRRPDDRQPKGDPRLPCHRRSDGWLGQRRPSRSVQCTTAQKPVNQVSQPIIYGDLSSDPVTLNLGRQGGVPNLFGLPAPVHAGTVPAGATSTVPTAAERARGAPAARVNKRGIDTALRD